jgi:hypothetical protein
MSKFGDEFKAARAAGKKTFMFNGKSYTTRTADDNKKDAAAKAKDTPVAPAMDDATKDRVKRNVLEQAAIKGEQKTVTPASTTPVTKQVGRGGLNKGVNTPANLASAPKQTGRGPTKSNEEKAADAAARTKKAKADMKATKDRMSAKREEKSGFKLFPKMKHGGGVPKMKHGGSVRGDGIATKGKTKGTMR